jgi:hypothetical protein
VVCVRACVCGVCEWCARTFFGERFPVHAVDEVFLVDRPVLHRSRLCVEHRSGFGEHALACHCLLKELLEATLRATMAVPARTPREGSRLPATAPAFLGPVCQ